MAKKKIKNERKDQSIQELETTVRDLERELYALRSELSLNRKLEHPHQLKAKRKEKARVLTLLTIKQRSQEARKGV